MGTVTHDHKMLSASDRIFWFENGRIGRVQTRDQVNIKVGSID